ncbi:MAG: hypothetical protein EZS28_022658 [Streblomastix strix]|uniref:Uncharacterized protein n=1 Tax=Streblomastix strix TaxID=222440 RepID=A0A5J4VH44_9EUKA|nr:MAG: hypothetical protein EZS28_022658 [Streblomastix strix]
MKRFEHCIGKHVNSDVSQCDELKQLPKLVEQLSSEDGSLRHEALGSILYEIGNVHMELCRSEQFSKLLDGIIPLMQDAHSQEMKQATAIIELLSTQRLNMVVDEREKINELFKGKEKLVKLMKETFLNESIPKQLKESLTFSIFEWEIIENVKDPCFVPILDFLLVQLMAEEERLHIHPYDAETEIKRNKYGLSTFDAILDAFCVFCLKEEFKQEIANRGGIEIGIRYLTHQSAKIRVAASCICGIVCHKTIGQVFRENNDFIAILNRVIPTPVLKIVNTEHNAHIHSCKRQSQLHSGWYQEANLCVNCDLQPSSNKTTNSFDLNYRFIRNNLWTLRDLINIDHSTAQTLCLQMKERIKTDGNQSIKKKDATSEQFTQLQIHMAQFNDLLSKTILYIHHPLSRIRFITTQIVDFMYESGEKQWVINETKEIRRRQKIKLQEQRSQQYDSQGIQQDSSQQELIHKCSLSSIPIIFSAFNHEEDDETLQWSLWAIYDLLKRINDFLIEEKEEKTQKKLENDDADVNIECEECGQMVPFGRFLMHMKTHDALQDVHYEADESIQDIEDVAQDEDEGDSPYTAWKRVIEDLDGEGLMEMTQSQLYQVKETKHNATMGVYITYLNYYISH